MQILTLHFTLFFNFKTRPIMKHKIELLLICLLAVVLTSCNENNRFKIDTTKNRTEVTIKRFDKDLLSLGSTNINTGVKKLYEQYPEFLPLFTANILDTMANDTVAVTKLISQFLTDTAFINVNKKTLDTFNDISDIENKVSDAYTYIHHYFPEVKLPELYFFVSGFNRSVLLNENFIALGTDMYLGADYPAYENVAYKYLTYNMRKESVAVDLVSATLFRMFVMNSSKERLVDNMLFRGKVMYLQSVFMSTEKPELLMGYTPEQLKWCTNNEKQIWGAIIDQKDLFSTNNQLINKYLNDAPFTAPISQESPGRLGTWIGWQVVSSYMNNNKKVGIRELMDENDYQKILENSAYRP